MIVVQDCSYIVYVWSQYDGANIEQRTIGYEWCSVLSSLVSTFTNFFCWSVWMSLRSFVRLNSPSLVESWITFSIPWSLVRNYNSYNKCRIKKHNVKKKKDWSLILLSKEVFVKNESLLFPYPWLLSKFPVESCKLAKITKNCKSWLPDLWIFLSLKYCLFLNYQTHHC